MKAKTTKKMTSIMRKMRKIFVKNDAKIELKRIKKEINRCVRLGEYYAMYDISHYRSKLYLDNEDYLISRGYRIEYYPENNSVEIWWGK